MPVRFRLAVPILCEVSMTMTDVFGLVPVSSEYLVRYEVVSAMAPSYSVVERVTSLDAFARAWQMAATRQRQYRQVRVVAYR